MNDDYTVQQKAVIAEMKASIRQGQLTSSIVEMQSDYENDNAMSLTSVVFLSPAIAQTVLEKIIQPLREIEPDHCYYSAEQLHLTIKNVRKMHKPPLFTEADAFRAHQLFQQIIPQFPAFMFNLEELILFPTSVALLAYSSNTLRKLVRALDLGLKEIGLPDDKKYVSETVFFGNATLCRFVHPPSQMFQRKVSELEGIRIGEISITEIQLIVSNCVCNQKMKRAIGTYSLKS